MDFTFSDDQAAFRQSMSRFLMIEAAPELLREVWETEVGRCPELRAKIAAQGLTALSVPERDGGLGLGDIDWALMTQEIGYYALPDSLADGAYVAAALLADLEPGHALRDEWLPKIADGSAAVALGHPVNPWVADARHADLLLMACPTATGLALHALKPEQVQLEALLSIDASRRLCRVHWTPGPTTQVLDGVKAQPMWDEALDRANLNIAGQLIGLAQSMLDRSVDYVSQRKQFGKAIGSFQAVKHHLADVVTHIEFAKPVLYRAAVAVAEGDANRAALVSHARLVCGEAALAAGRKGIQTHGAMGYTWEVDLQMFMKRAWVLDSAWGDRAFHKARLKAALLAGDALLGPSASLIKH